MAGSVCIRAAALADRTEVLSMLTEAGLPEAGISNHWDTTWVAADSDRVVGSVALEVHTDAALLRSLAIRSDRRSEGLGGRLVDFALGRARERKLATIALLTTTAAPFFAKRGFTTASWDDVPASLKSSAEFRGACPSSAIAMLRRID